MLSLRPYQREAIDALTGKERELIALPTGGGKTFVFAHKAAEHIAAHPADRVVIGVHTDELVAQAYAELIGVAPHLKVGIVKGSKRDVFADVIVASIQTLRNPKVLAMMTCVGLLIVDEAHHATAASYQKVMEGLGVFDGRCQAVGVTATPSRGDGKSLFPTWTRVAFQREISWMVRKRYLIPPRGKAVCVPDLDLRNVKSTKSDYREGELGEALAESLAPELVVKAWLDEAKGERTLGFFPTVASAEVFRDAFIAAGVGAELVHGGMPLGDEHRPEPGTRRRVIADHKAGKFPVLVNCMILTEGYNDKKITCIIVGRPTKSKPLYVQIVGRGLRVDDDLPYDGQSCLILDVVGASATHGDLRSLADLSVRPLKEADVHSGRTLLDLEDEFDAGEGVGADEVPLWTGDVVVRDFDPLGNTTSKVWLKTRRGTHFVPSGKSAYVFIMEYPEAGLWSVAWCNKQVGGQRFVPDEEGVPRAVESGGREVGMTIHRGLPLDQAMIWAEDLAVDMGVDLNASKKSAPWRKKPASSPQIGLARSLGIKLTEVKDEASGMVLGVKERMGEVYDKITYVKGSQRVDPLVASIQDKVAR